MSHAQLAEATNVSEPIMCEQICECYPNKWVCLVEIDSVNDPDSEFAATTWTAPTAANPESSCSSA